MDKRILKSEQALKNAFVRLMQNKDPGKIRVTELCHAAKVNRSTFYARYGYMHKFIYAVLEDCIQDISKYSARLLQSDSFLEREQIREYIRRFVENSTIKRISVSEDMDFFCQQIIQIHVELTLEKIQKPRAYYATYFQNAGVISLLMKWIKEKKPCPEEELLTIIYMHYKTMVQGIANA